MKAVMLSIKPKYVALIANGKKTIEVRKTRPNIDTPFKCYIYCTKHKPLVRQNIIDGKDIIANGKVIGEFVCDEIEELHEWELSPKCDFEMNRLDLFLKESCVSYGKLCEYRKNLPYIKPLYGWHISDLVIYDKPRELGEFYSVAKSGSDCCVGCIYYETSLEELPCRSCDGERNYLYRPPQSWQYVEEKENENE